jgi:dihydroceramide fatty acyl 2-hydroxylase
MPAERSASRESDQAQRREALAAPRADAWTEEARAALEVSWREHGQPGREGVAHLFASPLVDSMWRAPWWWPYALALPLALAALALSLVMANDTSAFVQRVGWMLAGALGWTLFEHCLHRYVFHARGQSEVARAILLIVHGHHHVWPKDRGRLTATPWQAGLTIAPVYGVMGALLPALDALALTSGFTLAYVAYEAMHFVAHHGRPRSRLLRAIRAHHLRHHHEDPTSRWGISSPLWDHVLRTLPPGQK